MAGVLLAVLAMLSCVLDLQQDQSSDQSPPSSQPASQPSGRTSPRHPFQAEIYKELLRDSEGARAKPILSVDIDARQGAAEGGKDADKPLLLEGTVLRERTGRLVWAGDRSEFHFNPGSVPEGASASLEVLRNGWLEAMEREAEAGVKEFVITAEVTRYRGNNYLLLRKYRRQIAHGNLGP
jgi:hypothetical protein